MQRIVRRLFTAAICCAIAGIIFCAINQQQWNVVMPKTTGDNFDVTRDTVVTITRSYKQLGLGLFVLSGALMVTAGLVINRYGHETTPAKQAEANAGEPVTT